MNSIVTNARAVFRTVILIGVLCGLLFSCGEGIQLLPFPVFERAIEEGSRFGNIARSAPEKNILHREQKQANQQFKPKRDVDKIVLGWSTNFLNSDTRRVSVRRQRRDLAPESQILHSQIAASKVLGRAPPLT